MKAPNKELRKWVYDKLNGNVSGITGVSGIIPVKSVPGKDQSFPFIWLGNISVEDESTKDSYITRATMQINVESLFADENASFNQVEEISDKIFGLLIDVKGDTTSFEIVISRFVSSQESFEQTETGKEISNQINIEFLIEEL